MGAECSALASTLLNPKLFAGQQDEAQAVDVAGRVYELTEFLVDVLQIERNAQSAYCRIFVGENRMTSTFRQTVRTNLAKPEVRANFYRAMDGLMTRRLDQFPDRVERERLRTQSMAIRANALSKLPKLLEQLEANLTRNGIQVH